MKDSSAIPRTSLSWILLALTAVILPHVPRLPGWITALSICCVLLRLLIEQGRLSYPGGKTKAALVTVTLAALLLHYGNELLTTQATVSVLILGIALKLLEMREPRDFLLVGYLSYFTLAAVFIQSQSIPVALYGLACALLITTAMLSLQQGRGHGRVLRPLQLASVILLQSLPLMLALYLLFPRIAPLWSVPLQQGGGLTGLDDTLEPGQISSLTRSAEVAFRVRFESAAPANADLYWRGLTLDRFDGRQWSRQQAAAGEKAQYLGAGAGQTQNWYAAIEYLGRPVNYTVMLEPTRESWLFSLKMPYLRQEGLLMGEDFQLRRIRPVNQRFHYSARSYLQHRATASLSPERRRTALMLPAAGNEQSRALAQRLRSSSGSAQAYIAALLRYFNQQPFFYTPDPGRLGNNPVDAFLFDTREGFCEHYASAFAFLLRAAGIPARVVTGYQGGEYNPYDGILVVRQYDAHAWTEAWLDGRGWVRIDPTEAVAPQRIHLGSRPVLQDDAGFLNEAGFSLLRFAGVPLLNSLRLRLETLDHAWNRLVLNYNEDLQLRLFSQLYAEVSKEKIRLTLLGLIVLLVLVVALLVLRHPGRPRGSPATAMYLRWCERLARQGYARQRGETPSAYSRRLCERCPHWSAQVKGITDVYLDLVFAQQQEASAREPEKLRDLRRRIRRFRPRAATGNPIKA